MSDKTTAIAEGVRESALYVSVLQGGEELANEAVGELDGTSFQIKDLSDDGKLYRVTVEPVKS